MKNIILIVINFVFVVNLFGQKFNSAAADSLFQILNDHEKWMGSVTVTRGNKVIYSRSTGWSDVGQKLKSNENTLYRIGSITKTFTATLVMLAIEEGKLHKDSRLSDYFPLIPKADAIDISMMLRHRSGIANYTSDPAFLTYYTQPVTESKMVELIIKGGSVFKPGERAEYSNSNYVLLTYILEKIYKKSYQDLLTEKITSPLRLVNTRVGNTTLLSNESYSYSGPAYSVKEAQTDMSVPSGAGNIISNGVDLCQFITALFEGKIINKASLAFMTEIKDGYGAGIFEYPYGEKTGYGHTGGIDAFTSLLGTIPEDKLAISVLSNYNQYDNNQIIVSLLNAAYGSPVELPGFTSMELSEAQLLPLTGLYKSDQLPIDIEITISGSSLQAQGKGQSPIILDAQSERVFSFAAAGIIMEFEVQNGKMILRQGGGVYNYKKE